MRAANDRPYEWASGATRAANGRPYELASGAMRAANDRPYKWATGAMRGLRDAEAQAIYSFNPSSRAFSRMDSRSSKVSGRFVTSRRSAEG